MGILVLRYRRARRLHADAGRWRMNDDVRIDPRVFGTCLVYCLGNEHDAWSCKRYGVPSRRKLAEIADRWRSGPQGLPRRCGDCGCWGAGLGERGCFGTEEKTQDRYAHCTLQPGKALVVSIVPKFATHRSMPTTSSFSPESRCSARASSASATIPQKGVAGDCRWWESWISTTLVPGRLTHRPPGGGLDDAYFEHQTT